MLNRDYDTEMRLIMYRNSKNSILKHSDFMFLDAICILLSYVIAYVLRHGHIKRIALHILLTKTIKRLEINTQ